MKNNKSNVKAKFCLDLKAQLADEGKATIDYAQKAKELRKMKDPASQMAATIYDLLAKQEASHDEALRKIQREVCPI